MVEDGCVELPLNTIIMHVLYIDTYNQSNLTLTNIVPVMSHLKTKDSVVTRKGRRVDKRCILTHYNIALWFQSAHGVHNCRKRLVFFKKSQNCNLPICELLSSIRPSQLSNSVAVYRFYFNLKKTSNALWKSVHSNIVFLKTVNFQQLQKKNFDLAWADIQRLT